MKVIYLWFCCRRSCYLYILQNACFYIAKKEILLLLFVLLRKKPAKSWNFVEIPGKVLKL